MTKKKTYGYRYKYLVIDGVYYESDMKDGKTILVPVPEKRLKKEIKLAEEIVDRLEKDTDIRKILMEAVMSIDDKEREKLHNMLYTGKRKYAIKTRDDHCVDIKLGNFVLPIIH